jgi:NADH-quinone oxidoreductase subunit G
VAIVLSAQHSNEDNFALATLGKAHLGASDVFLAAKANGEADTILRDADKNPNRKGATQIAERVFGKAPRSVADLTAALGKGTYSYVLALGGGSDPDAPALAKALEKCGGSVAFAAHEGPVVASAHVAVPICVWAETSSTFVNRQGLAQRSERALLPRGHAAPGWLQIAKLARAMGFPLEWKRLSDVQKALAPAPAPASELAAATAP